MNALGLRDPLDGDAAWLARCAPAWLRERPTQIGWMQALARGLPGAAVAAIAGTPIGLVHLGEIDGRNRRASVQLWALPDARRSPALGAALRQWTQVVFDRWPLHRLTFEWCEDETSPPGLGEVFRIEGRLARQRWVRGDWRDVTLWACHRDPHVANAPRLARRAAAPVASPPAARPERVPIDRAVQLLRGRHVTIRAITVDDEPFLHRLATDPLLVHRWRAGHELPDARSYARWRQSNNEVDVIVETHDGRAIGELVLYSWDRLDGVAYFGCAFLPEMWGAPPVIDALRHFLRYSFDVLGVRKLCLEIPEWNVDRVGSGLGRLLDVEAVQEQHLWRNGRPWSQTIAALWPSQFRRRDR